MEATKNWSFEPDLDEKQTWLNVGTASNCVLPFRMKDKFWQIGAQIFIMIVLLGTEKSLIWPTLTIRMCWSYETWLHSYLECYFLEIVYT